MPSTPRQVHLQHLLGYDTPVYAHVPLVLGADGQRLAKRHGACTLAQLDAVGVSPARVLAVLGASLGLCAADDARDGRRSVSPVLVRSVAACAVDVHTIWHDDPAMNEPFDVPIDDLDRILGYRGCDGRGHRATNDSPGWATSCTRTPFWTPEMCAAVIRAAEAVGAFEQQPDDPVPGHEVSLALISPRLFEAVEIDIGRRIWPRLRTVWPYVDYHGLRDVFVIRYALGEQESLRIHHDVAQLSGSVKLNDDYRGGELDFPRQGFTNVDDGGRRAAGVALAGDASAPDEPAARRCEVRPDDLVRAAHGVIERPPSWGHECHVAAVVHG